MNEVERRFEVHVNHHIPLLFAHTHHQTVTSNTCVVDQYIDTAEILNDFCNHFCGILKIRSIRRIAFSLNT